MTVRARWTNSAAPVRFGVDRLLTTAGMRAGWRRVGLVTNNAARPAATPHVLSRVALREAGVPVVRLFGPEHGLTAAAADGAAVADSTDPATGLPVVSLYGERMRPAAAQVADLDVVLFDIPDVGARFYTYAWTLWHVLHGCAEAGVPLMVLDRPNPLGGVLASVEGPGLDPACRSFIGESNIPVRHSVTLGELARLWQREHCPQAPLTVVPCVGWDRGMAWPATGCAWVPTSPSMPRVECAFWYPGTCLFEATNVSVGRGTEAPFTVVGAPWLDARRLANAVRAAGITMAPQRFTPGSGPYAGVACEGIALDMGVPHPAHFVAHALRPVQLGLALLAAVAAHHPHEFAWAPYATAANPSGHDHLSRLLGRPDIAPALGVGGGAAHASPWRPAEWTRAADWPARVRPVLLYDEATTADRESR